MSSAPNASSFAADATRAIAASERSRTNSSIAQETRLIEFPKIEPTHVLAATRPRARVGHWRLRSAGRALDGERTCQGLSDAPNRFIAAAKIMLPEPERLPAERLQRLVHQ